MYKCKLCNKFHALKVCPKFLKMTPKQRNVLVLKETYCVNCLARSHRFRDCRSRNMCRRCGRPHNTLLHPNYTNRKGNQTSNNSTKSGNNSGNNSSNNSRDNNNSNNNQCESGANQKILSEAIRALATVLCSSPK